MTGPALADDRPLGRDRPQPLGLVADRQPHLRGRHVGAARPGRAQLLLQPREERSDVCGLVRHLRECKERALRLCVRNVRPGPSPPQPSQGRRGVPLHSPQAGVAPLPRLDVSVQRISLRPDIEESSMEMVAVVALATSGFAVLHRHTGPEPHRGFVECHEEALPTDVHVGAPC